MKASRESLIAGILVVIAIIGAALHGDLGNLTLLKVPRIWGI